MAPLRLLLSASLGLTLLTGCGDSDDDGLVKHQVTGQVLINGTPEKGIAVTFKHTDPSVTGNAARPVAVTDQQGRYTLSTNGSKDGAVSGKYIVSFFWPQGGSSSRDFLEGKYTKTRGPNYEVDIKEGDTEIPPFELKASPASVQAAHKALNSPAIMN